MSKHTTSVSISKKKALLAFGTSTSIPSTFELLTHSNPHWHDCWTGAKRETSATDTDRLKVRRGRYDVVAHDTRMVFTSLFRQHSVFQSDTAILELKILNKILSTFRGRLSLTRDRDSRHMYVKSKVPGSLSDVSMRLSEKSRFLVHVENIP